MANIFNQITNLIVQPSGSMVYHLVIAFIFISILQPALSFIATEDKNQRKRLLIGVGLLIASRLLVFIVSILSILETSGVSNTLGVVEQVVNALDITIIVWLFAFHKGHKTGDIGLALFGLLILASGIISTIYWGIQGEPGSYIQSSLATIWEMITLVVILIGLVTITVSKSPARIQGLTLMTILLLGEGFQLFYKTPGMDYFPISRLAHLIAFPLLVGILQNFISARTESIIPSFESDLDDQDFEAVETDYPGGMIAKEEAQNGLSTQSTSSIATKALELKTYIDSLSMATASTPQEICSSFTKLTAQALLADVCILLAPPDSNDQVHLVAGYDLIVQENINGTSFDSNLIPRFKKLFENGRAIHLLDQGNEKMSHFAEILQVDEIGNMMAFPIMGEEDEIIAIIGLLSPYSKHIWNADDQEYLQSATDPIKSLIQKAVSPQTNQHASELLKEELEKSEAEIVQLREENQRLEEQIEELSANIDQGPPLPPEIEDLIVQTKSLESAIKMVQEDNQTLTKQIEQLTAENEALDHEKSKTLAEKQALAKDHARLLEEQRVLATEHAFVLEEKAAFESQAEASQDVQAQIDALTFANDDLARKNQEILAQVEMLTDEKNELKILSEEMAQRNTGIGKISEKLEDQISQLQEENTLLRENLSQLQGEHEGILTSLSENDSQSNGLQEELKKSLEAAAEFEQKLAEANEALEALKQFRTKANQQTLTDEQDEVIASIAQELRQPMSSISGYTDLLISESVGILGALQKKFLERVKASIERMNQLVNDLVNVTTLDSGNYLFTLQPLELMEVFDNAIETTSGQFREKEISLRVNIHPNLPKLHTDKDALQQIVLHLLQNAGTATPTEGEVLLKAQLYDKTNDDVILLSVTDTGEGIPKEDLPRVFSRLYRADNPLIEGVGDTGVGLSIAKTLTEALGGRIWVESEPNSGSTYSVLLPTVSPAMTTQEG